MKLCECGCGAEIVPRRQHRYGAGGRFLPGHHVRVAAREGRPPRKRAPIDAALIPSGLCECGCGGQTATVKDQTVRSKRYFLGHPAPRLPGHGAPRRGAASHRWKGGRWQHATGYIYVHAPDHPDATSDGYVLEHRLVMERVLGRRLDRREIVHHENGQKDDNRPENLRLLAGQSEHAREHAFWIESPMVKPGAPHR